MYFDVQEDLHQWRRNQGGWGGAGAPLKFVKGGLSPPEMNLFLVNTYLKVSLYILLTHTLLYILTLQKLAMLVQRSGSRKGSTAMCMQRDP